MRWTVRRRKQQQSTSWELCRSSLLLPSMVDTDISAAFTSVSSGLPHYAYFIVECALHYRASGNRFISAVARQLISASVWSLPLRKAWQPSDVMSVQLWGSFMRSVLFRCRETLAKVGLYCQYARPLPRNSFTPVILLRFLFTLIMYIICKTIASGAGKMMCPRQSSLSGRRLQSSYLT